LAELKSVQDTPAKGLSKIAEEGFGGLGSKGGQVQRAKVDLALSIPRMVSKT